MPIAFQQFQLLYPPHPAATWKPDHIGTLSERAPSEWVAQFKYDDWRTMIYFFPDGRIEFYGRKKEKLPRYRPPASMIAELRGLNLVSGRFHVLDGGLLHYKTPRVKNTLVLWDILVHESSYLLGTGFGERYALLEKIVRKPDRWATLFDDQRSEDIPVALTIAKTLWLAPIFRTKFKQLFDMGSRLPEIEGIVLKNTRMPLQRAFRMEDNASWMIRVRKPRIGYQF